MCWKKHKIKARFCHVKCSSNKETKIFNINKMREVNKKMNILNI